MNEYSFIILGYGLISVKDPLIKISWRVLKQDCLLRILPIL
jgi:hypothetical protein